MMTRKQTLYELAQIIRDIQRPHTVRVAIDGVDASGKTWLARELSQELRSMDSEIISISIDNFHNEKSLRYARGRESAEGFYLDSYHYDAFRRKVLEPLGPGGSRQYISAHWNLKTDKPIFRNPKTASKNSILIVDGIFLHRRELRDYWDFSVYVHCDFTRTLLRMLERNSETTDGPEETVMMFERRYRGGQEIYIKENAPKERATAVWDNNDLKNPELRIARSQQGACS